MHLNQNSFPKKSPYRGLARLFDRCCFAMLSLFLALMIFFNFGLNLSTHTYLIPLVSLLLFFHGLTNFFYMSQQGSALNLFRTPILFLPFLIWLIINGNFLSVAPWLSKLDMIYYFEAYVVLWVSFYHLNSLKRIGLLIAILTLPVLYALYVGVSQFFHGRNLGDESEVIKGVSGLFFEPTSFVFLLSVIVAALIPATFLRYWEKTKQVGLFILGCLFFFGALIAQDLFGYSLLTLALVVGACFGFNTLKRRSIFLLRAFLIAFGLISALFVLFPLFGERFYVPFEFAGHHFYFEILKASVSLIEKVPVFGVGLANFSLLTPSLENVQLPMLVDNPSSSILLITSELGIVGMALIILPLFLTIKQLIQILKQSPKREIRYSKSVVSTNRYSVSIILSFIISAMLGTFLLSVSRVPFFLCLMALALSTLGMYVKASDCFLQLRSKLSRYVYLFFCLLLATSFFQDSQKLIASKSALEHSRFLYEQSFQENEYGTVELLEKALVYVDLSLERNNRNVDAWILKNEIINGIYNSNLIRYSAYKELLVETSEKAVELAGSYWKSWLRYGVSLGISGDLIESEKVLLKAVEMAPQSFEANYFMATYLMEESLRIKEARRFAERALEIEPKNPLAQEIIRKLKI